MTASVRGSSRDIPLVTPEWGVGFDTDFEQAAQARKKILGELTGGRHRVFSYHLPLPGLGHVRSRDKGFEWVMQAFATV